MGTGPQHFEKSIVEHPHGIISPDLIIPPHEEEEKTNFSVITPIHNEAEYLPYSLPTIYRLNPDEVILIFDRCTDESRKVSEEIAEEMGFTHRTEFVEMNGPSPGWTFRKAGEFMRLLPGRAVIPPAVVDVKPRLGEVGVVADADGFHLFLAVISEQHGVSAVHVADHTHLHEVDKPPRRARLEMGQSLRGEVRRVVL